MNAIQQMSCDGLSEEVLAEITAEEEALRARRRKLVEDAVGWIIFLAILALVLGLAGGDTDLSGNAPPHIRIISPR